MSQVVLVVNDKGPVLAPDDSPIKELFDAMPEPPVGTKALPLYAWPAGLVAKATILVTLLDDADRNHGGLAGEKTLRAANELRLELSKWK